MEFSLCQRPTGSSGRLESELRWKCTPAYNLSRACRQCYLVSDYILFLTLLFFSHFRSVEGSDRPYHYDRYLDCRSVVHLRRREGGPRPSTAASPIHARVTPDEVGGQAGVRTLASVPTEFAHIHVMPSRYSSAGGILCRP